MLTYKYGQHVYNVSHFLALMREQRRHHLASLEPESGAMRSVINDLPTLPPGSLALSFDSFCSHDHHDVKSCFYSVK